MERSGMLVLSAASSGVPSNEMYRGIVTAYREVTKRSEVYRNVSRSKKQGLRIVRNFSCFQYIIPFHTPAHNNIDYLLITIFLYTVPYFANFISTMYNPVLKFPECIFTIPSFSFFVKIRCFIPEGL